MELEALNSTSTAQEVTFKMEVGGRAFEKSQTLPTGTSPVYAEIEMGDSILLWDEFHPHLYQLNVHLSGTDGKELSHCYSDKRTESIFPWHARLCRFPPYRLPLHGQRVLGENVHQLSEPWFESCTISLLVSAGNSLSSSRRNGILSANRMFFMG